MSATAGSPWRLAAPLALMATIFFFSAQPFEGDPLAWWEVVIRKLGHFTGYALLTAAWIWALAGRVPRPLLLAAALAFLYSCSDELHQTTVEGRTGTPLDVLIDTVGIAFAVGAGLLLSSRGVARTKPGRYAGRANAEAAKAEQIKDAGSSPKRAHTNRA